MVGAVPWIHRIPPDPTGRDTMSAQHTRRPLIGVTAGTGRMMSGAWEGHQVVTLTAHYVEALRAAGARPVIIAAQDGWSEDEIAELDGLVLSGGADLDPAAAGEEPLPTDLPADAGRDSFEISLYRAARRAGVPVLGVCRGLQLICRAEGGSLLRHLPTDVPEHPRCDERPTPVTVQVEADSDTALALGTGPSVLAYHHQAVAEIGSGLRVSARHSSGVVMGVEATAGSLVIGVQWHPELDAEGRGLFATLVRAARHRHADASGVAAGLR